MSSKYILRLGNDGQFQNMLIYLIMIQPMYFWIFVLQKLNLFAFLSGINSLTFYLILYIFLIPLIAWKFSRNLKKSVIAYVFFWIILILLSCFRENGWWGLRYNNFVLWIIGSGIPAFILVSYIPFTNGFYKKLVHISRLFSIITILVYLMSSGSMTNWRTQDYYMFFSAGAAILASVLLISFFEDKNLLDGSLAMIMTILILLGGARGNLVQLGALILFYLVFKKRYGVLLIGAGLFVVAALLLSKYSDILLKMSLFRNSRTASFLLSDDFFGTNRGQMYNTLMEYFNGQGLFSQLFGLGLGGERQFVARRIHSAGYPHQIFLEILVQYGYIGGGLLILILLFISIFTFFYIIKHQKNQWFGSLLLAMTIPLLVSGSYAASFSFHLWVGFCVRTIIGWRHEKFIDSHLQHF